MTLSIIITHRDEFTRTLECEGTHLWIGRCVHPGVAVLDAILGHIQYSNHRFVVAHVCRDVCMCVYREGRSEAAQRILRALDRAGPQGAGHAPHSSEAAGMGSVGRPQRPPWVKGGPGGGLDSEGSGFFFHAFSMAHPSPHVKGCTQFVTHEARATGTGVLQGKPPCAGAHRGRGEG